MKVTLTSIVVRSLKNGASINAVLAPDGESIAYEISGFSKSGSATLYTTDNGNIICSTRYGQVDAIESWEDLVEVDFTWWSSYKDRGYEMPDEWRKEFIACNFIKEPNV